MSDNQDNLPVLIMQALPANALQLATLAGEINAMESVRIDMAAATCMAVNKTLIHTVKQGEKIRQAKAQVQGSFTAWLKVNCPAIGRTSAYNYMALAEKMAHLLDDSVVQTAGRLLSDNLSQSQIIALISAPEELQIEVSARVDAGEKVPVDEIDRLRKKAQQADEDYIKVAAENAELLRDKNALEDAVDDFKREVEVIKSDKGFNALVIGFVAEQVDTEKAKLQQDVDTLVAQHATDYQSQIDHLQDKLSTATNNLVKAKNPAVLVELNNQIVDLENELARTAHRLETANAEVAYRGIATHAIESSASMTISLLDLSDALIVDSATTELLLRAAHDLSGIVELLQKAAAVEQFDIEG
jgi:hypothetical protein